ncbi:MAG: PrsW family glutamic-type intramembrane protease, partial [Bacteroidales bacterium]|nr:PrsW family glutamic-type intramembrane protease [Bacteroidales bacterium]
SFKLVKIPDLVVCVLWGMLCAAGVYFINTEIMNGMDIGKPILSRYLAPIVEETLKIFVIILLIWKNRIGFMIDGAIYGFGVGAGFALVENTWYLMELSSPNLLLWTVRGFGTAIMHGGTISIFSILVMRSLDRGNRSTFSFIYSWLAAVLMHSFFNHFVMPPVTNMLFTLVIMALAEYLIFKSSEKDLKKWLELEFDTEVKLLLMIRKGQFSKTHTGEYITFIKDRFAPLAVVDMLAYIALYLELSVKAKSRLMLHEAGIPAPKEDSVDEKLAELNALERNIGVTGLLAIAPVLRVSRRDLWKWSSLK